MKNKFLLSSSKADTINYLANKKIKFNVPKTYSFNVSEWINNKNLILNNIRYNFSKDKIKFVAIRSSSKNEDNLQESAAGKFLSILNVQVNNKKKIKSSIVSVIKSYGNKKNKKDQVIIQEMISNVSVSGVVFTKNIDNGTNYYVINYDDVTGKTNTVTSGKGIYSNRILYIFKNYKNKIKSPRFKILINCVKDLENYLKYTSLDIEFVVTKNLKVYLLQVRPISTSKKWSTLDIKSHEKVLKSSEKILKKKFKKANNKILGKKTIFGQMPDWNPVEIIGKNPSALSYSLYRLLITDHIWAKARAIMGYKDMSKNKLMHSICGQPFIDVRLSLNSFLPKNLSNKIAKKIIDNGINTLNFNPNFHDKVEFEISSPSFAFNTKNILKSRLKNTLTIRELNKYVESLKSLTRKFLDDKQKFSLFNLTKKIEKLDKSFDQFNSKDISQIPKLISICKNIGTLNFSILARHGFVAKSFLNSLIAKKVFSKSEVEIFEQSLNTITSEMLKDTILVKKKILTKNKFMKKYGHLRPGTYDITSKRYDEIAKFNFNLISKKSYNKKLSLKNSHIRKINNQLKINHFYNISHEKFLYYISQAISLREYSKFIFTKFISLILKIIYQYGKKHGLKKSELAHININNFLSNKKYIFIRKLKKIALKNIKKHNLNKMIMLPMLIKDISRIRIIPFQTSSPNFITRKKIDSQYIYNPDISKQNKVNKKIVLIENADPGYDWIFGNKILALITKYGGINSHMAIRCAELSIPAAIGCGDQIFSQLLKKKSIYLDCSSTVIYSH